MISFVLFKDTVLRAFEGEPVVVSVARKGLSWFVWLQSSEAIDAAFGVGAMTNSQEFKTVADCRAYALRCYADFLEGFAENTKSAVRPDAGRGE